MIELSNDKSTLRALMLYEKEFLSMLYLEKKPAITQKLIANTSEKQLTLFETGGGGQICPGRHKPVCHFPAKCARVTKIHDFVPFHVRLVLERLFFKFSNFF